MKEPYIVALAVLLIAVLLFRIVKGIVFGLHYKGAEKKLNFDDPELKAFLDGTEKGRKARETVRKITGKVSTLETAFEKSAYYCAAGHVAANRAGRPGLAVGLYLRALREDPVNIEAFERLTRILVSQKRFRRLQWTCWEILGRLNDSETGSRMWVKCWTQIASIYAHSERTVRRSDAVRKMLGGMESDESD